MQTKQGAHVYEGSLLSGKRRTAAEGSHLGKRQTRSKAERNEELRSIYTFTGI